MGQMFVWDLRSFNDGKNNNEGNDDNHHDDFLCSVLYKTSVISFWYYINITIN